MNEGENIASLADVINMVIKMLPKTTLKTTTKKKSFEIQNLIALQKYLPGRLLQTHVRFD